MKIKELKSSGNVQVTDDVAEVPTSTCREVLGKREKISGWRTTFPINFGSACLQLKELAEIQTSLHPSATKLLQGLFVSTKIEVQKVMPGKNLI